MSARSVPPDEGASSSQSQLTSEKLVKSTPIGRGVKHYGFRMRLHCRTGYSLAILPDGKVIADEYGDNSGGMSLSLGFGDIDIDELLMLI